MIRAILPAGTDSGRRFTDPLVPPASAIPSATSHTGMLDGILRPSTDRASASALEAAIAPAMPL